MSVVCRDSWCSRVALNGTASGDEPVDKASAPAGIVPRGQLGGVVVSGEE